MFPIPLLLLPGIITQKTTSTQVLVSGSALRRTQIKMLVKLIYFFSSAKEMLLFTHVRVHSFIPDQKFKAQSG